MANFSSNNITVFPSVKRGDQPSRNLSEKNIVGLINKLLDNSGTFVISNSVSTSSDNFEFMINGYYFCIIPGDGQSVSGIFDSLSSGGSNLYASIEFDSTYDEIDGEDADDVYTGVTLSTSSGDLHIATKDGNSWVVPLGSRRKYNGSCIYDTIDGNEP